jgi:hypothetical protein
MIGNGYWATGLTLKPLGNGPKGFDWHLYVDFYDDGFCDENSTEGTLRHRYVTTEVVRAAEVLKVDAERLGIRFNEIAGAPPAVYVEGDGEWQDIDYPANWREVASAVAEALGFQSSYEDPVR